MLRKLSAYLLAASTGIAVAISSPSTTLAQDAESQCRPDREGAVAHLQRKYGEVPVARGLTSAGSLLDVLTSADGSTWSILLTFPDGSMTCLVSSGENWRAVAPAPTGERS